MPKLENIKIGQILFDYRRDGLRGVGCWTVEIIDIDLEKREVLYSYNGNAPQWRSERHIKNLKVNKRVKKYE
jgi:hypothetical protein